MEFAVAFILGLMTAGFAVLAVTLFSIERTLHHMAIQVSDLLSQITTISADVDALVARSTPTPAVDLQPVADALTALDAKVTAANPAPAV